MFHDRDLDVTFFVSLFCVVLSAFMNVHNQNIHTPNNTTSNTFFTTPSPIIVSLILVQVTAVTQNC